MTSKLPESNKSKSNDIDFDITHLQNDVDSHVAKKMNELLDVSQEADASKLLTNIDSEVDLAQLEFQTSSPEELDRHEIQDVLPEIKTMSVDEVRGSGTEQQKVVVGALYFSLAKDLTSTYASLVTRLQPDRESEGFDIKEAKDAMLQAPMPTSFGADVGLDAFFSGGSVLAKDIMNQGLKQQDQEVREHVMVDLMTGVNTHLQGGGDGNETIDNADYTVKKRSQFEKLTDIISDEEKSSGEKRKAGIQIGVGIAGLAALLGFGWHQTKKAVKKFKEKKWGGGLWSSMWGALGLAGAGAVALKFFRGKSPEKTSVEEGGIVSDEENLVENREKLSAEEKELFSQTSDAINTFYRDKIGFPLEGQYNAPDMQGEHQNEVGAEVGPINKKVAGGELALFVYSADTVSELVSGGALANKLMRKDAKELILGFVDVVGKNNINGMVYGFNMLLSGLGYTPVAWRGNLSNYKKMLTQLLEDHDDLKMRMSQELRRLVRFRGFMRHKTEQLKHSIAEKIMQKDGNFSSLSKEEQYTKIVEKLRDNDFMEKEIMPRVNSKFLNVTPREGLQYLHQEGLFDTNDHPFEKELQKSVDRIKGGMNAVLGIDEDDPNQEGLYDNVDNPEYDKIDKSFDTFFGDLEGFVLDDGFVKYLPIFDLFDLNDDIKHKLSVEMGLSGYIQEIGEKMNVLRSKRPLTASDLFHIKKEIQTFYRIQQELEMGTFFTLDSIQEGGTVKFRFMNLLSQLGDGIGKGGSAWRHLHKAVELMAEGEVAKSIIEGGKSAGVVAGSYLSLGVFTAPLRGRTPKLVKIGSFVVRKSLKLGGYGLGLGGRAGMKRFAPALFWKDYLKKPHLLRNHLLTGRVTVDQAQTIAIRAGITDMATIDNIYDALGCKTAREVRLFKKYKDNKNVMKSLIFNKKVDRSLKPRRNRSADKYVIEIRKSALEKLGNIDDVLKTVSGKEKEVFEQLLKNSRNIDDVADIVTGSARGKYMALYDEVSAVGKGMKTKQFAKLIAKYGRSNHLDLQKATAFVKANKATITHPKVFMSNMMKLLSSGVPLPTAADDIAKLNKVRGIARLNPALWKIDKLKLKKAQKLWSSMVTSLSKHPKLAHNRTMRRTLAHIRRASTASSESLGGIIASIKIVNPNVYKWLGRGLKGVGAIAAFADGGFAHRESNAMRKVNVEKADVMMQEAIIKYGLGATLLFVPGVGWIGLAAVVLVSAAIEMTSAAFSAIRSYHTNYQEYISMGKVACVNKTIAHINGHTGEDKSWKEHLGRAMPGYDFDTLFGDTADASLRALLMLDEIEHRFPLASSKFATHEQKAGLYSELLKKEGMKDQFPTLKLFTDEISHQFDQAKENENIRYGELQERMGTNSEGELDWKLVELANKKESGVVYITSLIQETRDSELNSMAQALLVKASQIYQRDTLAQEEIQEFGRMRNIESLAAKGKIQHPLQLILYKIATQVHEYHISPPGDWEALRALYPEDKAKNHGLYVQDDGKGIAAYDAWGYDARPGLDSGLDGIQLFFDGLKESMEEHDLIETESGSGEEKLSREYGREFLDITNQTLESLGKGKEKKKAQRDFLDSTIIVQAKNSPGLWIEPSIEDVIIGHHLELGGLGNGLYKFDGEQMKVWNATDGEQYLKDVPQVRDIYGSQDIV